MASLKIMGDRSFLAGVLKKWPEIDARGGHTVVDFPATESEQRDRAREILRDLVTVHHFTAVDTTIPSAPQRVSSDLDFAKLSDETQVVLIPQIAGGCAA